MSETERQLILKRIQQWADAAPVMQALRDDEVRQSVTAEGIRQLAGVAAMTLRYQPPRRECGLVEQQVWFSKLYFHDRTR